MILVKTPIGSQVLKDRSIALTPRQRSAFILCDGKRSLDDLLQAGTGVGREDIEKMIEWGLLGQVGQAGPAANSTTMAADADAAASSSDGTANPVDRSDPGPGQAIVSDLRSEQQRYLEAAPIATQLTAGLGLRGFRLNLAVEATTSFSELRALLPKIETAVGPDKAAGLRRALGA